MRHTDDTNLVERCLAGDQAAWVDLVNRYGRLVYSIPRRYGLSASEADDVFQNVFFIVHRRLPNLRNHKTLAAWLITITCRESWKFAKHRENGEELFESYSEDGMPPEDQVLHWEKQQEIRQALARVGEPCESLLKALFLHPEGLTYQEISAQLGIPLGSIGPTRARCFKKLEEILAAMDIDMA